MLAPIAYMTADLAVRVLPARAANGLAKALARIAFALRLPARRRLELNLARLLGAAGSRARALEAFQHFALSLAEFLRLAHVRRGAIPASVEVRGGEHLAAAEASGRGVIVLSAHIGNWEWGAAYLAARVTRLHVAARPHPSPWVEAFFARRRSAWGVAGLGGPPLWLAASRALRRREWVALMADRRGPAPLGTRPNRDASTPGGSGATRGQAGAGASRPARGARARGGSVCAWAAALSRRTGALVLPAAMLRLEGGRYAACFEPLIGPEACADGGYRDALRRILERDPGQWCAFEPLPEGLA